MSFGSIPTDGSVSQIPMSAVVPDGTNIPLALEGGPSITTGGNNLAPASMYVKDGNDLAQGATTDAAVVGDVSGSLSAKLRGLSKIFNDIWDSVNHRIKVDGSGITQPVSGTVTANAGTNLNTSLLALESGGNLASTATNTSNITTNTSNINTATGAKADAKATDSSSSWSVIALLKGIIDKLLTSIAVTQSGTWTIQPGNTANTTPWLVQDAVESSGGSIPYHNLTAATTNFTNVKAAAAQCYGINIGNTSASAIYVKLYDKATAPATTDVPKHTIYVPANVLVERAFPKGLKFANGFGWAATGAVADNDNTAIAANCIVDFDLNS